MREVLKKNHFWLLGAGLCLTYFTFQLFYTYYAILSVDEFWFSHWAHRYLHGLPYRDFSPYKTTLGYYFLLIPLSFSQHFLTHLLYAKNILALVNAGLFFLSIFFLQKHFSKSAVLITLALIISSEFVLSYSTNIRVDLLAYWLCLFSALYLLEKKYLTAGILLGLGFLTSQKSLWYVAASDITLGITWILFRRDWQGVREILAFNVSLFMTILVYILFWAYVADLHTVMHSIFYEAFVMYKLDLYNSARKLFWTYTIDNSPLLFLLTPMLLLSLFIQPSNKSDFQRLVFCVIFATFIMVCLIPFKQIFSYYMLTTIPAFLLGYSAFFTWVEQIFQNPHQAFKVHGLGSRGLWILLFGYYIGLIIAYDFFNLTSNYLLIGFIPLILGIYISKNPKTLKSVQPALPSLFWLTIVFTGIIYPLMNFSTILLPARDGKYQRSTLFVAHALLRDKTDYLAGIELFYDKNQPIPGMQHLDVPALAYLFHPSEKLLPIMMPSLYHSRATQSQILKSLQHSKVKLYVNNYRMHNIPVALKNYLDTQYMHYYGSIYLYAPVITAGNFNTFIRFSGNYQVLSNEWIELQGKKTFPNEIVKVSAGFLSSNSQKSYRLKLLPEISRNLNPSYSKDQWEYMLG